MNGLKNLKVRTKIFFIIFISTFALFAVGATGFYHMRTMKENTTEMYNDRLLPVRWVNIARSNLYIIKGNVLETMLTSDPSRQEELMKEIDKAMKENNDLIKLYSERELSVFEQERLKKYNTLISIYRVERERVLETLLTGNKEAAYLQFQQKANPALLEAERIIRELAEYNADTAEKLDLANTNSARNADRTILCIIIGAMVSSIAVGLFISRLITRPLKEVQRLMGIAETGDLTAVGSYYSKDEIGMLIKSYNQMLRGFRSVIIQIHETAHILAANSEELVASEEQARTASNQITNYMQAVSIGAAQQVEQLQQVTIATEEMVSGIQHIAVNTQNVEQASHHTKSQTEEGRAFVVTSVQQMKQISEAVKVSAEFIQYMHKSSQDIERIVTAITNISGQTNLLALNASIEAARAGENGRGFAVVADEVRKLAEQTAVSAQQIKQLIQQIQSQSSHCVESMSLVTEEVESGVVGMSKIDNAFEDIMQAVARMFVEVQAVASISQQLAVGSKQVAASAVQIADVSREATHSIHTVSVVSQSQEASMEDISQAAKSLANLAEDMQQTVGRFKF